jgi:hypothetical protein
MRSGIVDPNLALCAVTFRLAQPWMSTESVGTVSSIDCDHPVCTSVPAPAWPREARKAAMVRTVAEALLANPPGRGLLRRRPATYSQ